MREFSGKVAVITGAANGIGLALARACAREGMKVVLADIAAAALDRIAAELAAAKAEGLAMTCDVSRAAEVEELADVAFRRYGGVHLLCNNAGVAGTSAPCWAIRGEDWERDLGVNLWGVIHGVRAFLPRMLEQGEEGHVVNTASVMGLLPAAMAASYGVSKAGVVALSEALAIELAQAGSRIGVSVLCPAAVATDIAQSLKVEGEEGEAVRAAVLFQLAVPRGVVTDYAGLGMLVPLVVSLVEVSHLAKGGSHAIAHALWRALLRAGGIVRGTREVTRILVERGRATGVVLADGASVRAKKAVVSAIDLPQTFLRLVGEQALEPELARAVRSFKLDEFSLFGVHLALREPPRYAAAAHDPDLDRAFKVGIGFESVADFESMWTAVRRGEPPDPPRLYACCPTLFDPTQAPAGFHTAFCWAPAPYSLREGDWDRLASDYADRCLEAWRRAAPNMTKDNILARRVLSPLDVYRKMSSMPLGGVFHGRMTQDQLESFRPLPGLSDGRTPIEGLYLGGAALHPGGGILGACGYIAAGTVLSDLGIRAWW